MTKYLFGAATAALLMAMPGVAQAQRTPAATIVVVDTERLQSECTACRAAAAQLQTMMQNAQNQARALGQPIQTEANAIQQAAQAANNQPAGAARTAAEASLRQRAQALDLRQNQANQQIAQLEQNIRSTQANVARQLGEKLNPIYTQVMNAHGANLMLEMGATLAHTAALDVTNEVLAALNAAAPSVSVTPLPAAAPGTQPQGR